MDEAVMTPRRGVIVLCEGVGVACALTLIAGIGAIALGCVVLRFYWEASR